MTVIQWYPGHMTKAKRAMEEDIKIVDLSIIVLDARIPYSSYNPDFNKILNRKPVVVVLNKADLANGEMTKKWLQHYKDQGKCAAAINAQKNHGLQDLLRQIEIAAEPLMLSLEAKGRRRRPVRAMVVGSPNTGKSTLINSMMPRATAKTGNKPGVTRGKQWARINDKIELLDTPGVLWPKFERADVALRLAATGAIAETVYDYYDVSLQLSEWIMAKNPKALNDRYKVDVEGMTPSEFMEAMGRNRGMLAGGGVVRVEEAARLFLTEFRNGKIGKFTLDELEMR